MSSGSGPGLGQEAGVVLGGEPGGSMPIIDLVGSSVTEDGSILAPDGVALAPPGSVMNLKCNGVVPLVRVEVLPEEASKAGAKNNASRSPEKEADSLNQKLNSIEQGAADQMELVEALPASEEVMKTSAEGNSINLKDPIPLVHLQDVSQQSTSFSLPHKPELASVSSSSLNVAEIEIEVNAAESGIMIASDAPVKVNCLSKKGKYYNFDTHIALCCFLFKKMSIVNGIFKSHLL